MGADGDFAVVATGGVYVKLTGAWVEVPTITTGRFFAVVRDDCFFQATGNVFEGGVAAQVLGTGAAIAAGTSDQKHPGVINLTTGTTAAGRTGLGAAAQLASVRLGGGRARFLATFKLDALSSAAQRYTARMGFGDSWTADPVDGVFFRYTDSVNAGRWQGVARANNVESTLDLGTPAPDTGWHSYEFEVNAGATQVEFFIDGVSRGVLVSANIPTAVGRETSLMPVNVIKSVGTTASTFQIDLYRYLFEFTAPR